jgi:hypothetical protein
MEHTTVTHSPLSDQTYRRELGGGLVLRWSVPSDLESLKQLYGNVFRNSANSPFNTRIGHWVEDLMSGRHPLLGPTDFAIVEDTERGRLAAATCLMNQSWDYDGVALPVGRPEIVASEAEYRNRGLVRAIFELIHARSAARGHLALGITGIPYYYRQFGYEFALDLGGGRTQQLSAVPALKEGESEPYLLRRATPEDLPKVRELYERERARAGLSTLIDAGYWRYALDGMKPEGGEGWQTHLIADAKAEGQPARGYLLLRHRRSSDAVAVIALAVEPGVPLVGVLPSVARALGELGKTLELWEPKPEPPAPSKIQFELGREHPVYSALGPALSPDRARPYAWYVRVPDVPAFIRRVAPVLERRLAGSVQAGYTGDLKVSFYRGGLWLKFEQGRLASAEPWQAPVLDSDAMAGCPPLVFLQLLLGHRSLQELRDFFPDVWANDTGRTLLEALFPQRLSWVIWLD